MEIESSSAHDRARKGNGSIPSLTSQTDLHRGKSGMERSLWCQTRYRPIPLTCSVVQQMMARFRNLYILKKVKNLVKKGQKGAMRFKQVQIFIWWKKYFGVKEHFKWISTILLIKYLVCFQDYRNVSPVWPPLGYRLFQLENQRSQGNKTPWKEDQKFFFS